MGSPFRDQPVLTSSKKPQSIFRARLEQEQPSREEETERVAGMGAEALTNKARTSPFVGEQKYMPAHVEYKKARETNVFKHPLKYFATASPLDIPRDTFGFFFENEMAAMGIKWEGTTFPTISMNTFRRAWSEDPMWSTLGLASMALMVVPPAYASFKYGTLGAKVTGKGFRVTPQLTSTLRGAEDIASQGGEGYRRWGTALEDTLVQKEILDPSHHQFYFQQFKQYEGAEKGLQNFAEVDWLSQFWKVDDVAEWAKVYASPEIKQAIKGMDPADARKYIRGLDNTTKNAIFSNVPNASIKNARAQAYSQSKWQFLESKKMLSEMPDSGVKWTKVDDLKYKFNDWFGSAHARSTWALDPIEMNATKGAIISDVARNIERWNDPKLYGQILDNLPTEAATDNRWMHHLLHRYGQDTVASAAARGETIVNAIPAPSGGLDAKGQRLLDSVISMATQRQKAMVADGFIPAKTAEDIAWHFFTGHPATAAKSSEAGIKAKRSILRILNPDTGKVKNEFQLSVIPDLDDPSLLRREAGRSLEDMWTRFNDGKMIDNPTDLVLNSLVSDGTLWEAHKLTRDLMMRDDIAQPFSTMIRQFTANPATRKGWTDLNELLTVAQKQRMVRMMRKANPDAAKKMLGSGDELPFLKQEWYNEIFGRWEYLNNLGERLSSWTP